MPDICGAWFGVGALTGLIIGCIFTWLMLLPTLQQEKNEMTECERTRLLELAAKLDQGAYTHDLPAEIMDAGERYELAVAVRKLVQETAGNQVMA